MKLKSTLVISNHIIHLLKKHFEYSIKDIKSYDELTSEEKKIISRELFEKITTD